MACLVLTKENHEIYLPELRERVERSRFLIAVTGAGISTASGVPVLSERVEGVPLKLFFEQQLLQRDPKKYFTVYRHALTKWRQARPNAAHAALAAAGAWVITQNIDGLHRDVGTKHLIELHGNLRELHCPDCHLILSSELVFEQAIPSCPECGAVLFPGITLEGNEVRHFSRALDWAGRAQEALVIGTKLDMHPVRQLINLLVENETLVVVVNEAAEEIVPEVLSRIQGEPRYV